MWTEAKGMKLTKAEQKICDKYSTRDTNGRVHCYECPLVLNEHELMCKANATRKDMKEFK